MTASRIRIPGSLQVRLVLGFTMILAAALASLAAFSAYATRNEADRYAAAVAAAQAERAERAVADAYEGDQNWEAVQLAVEQVSALFDWRVVIASLDGNVLADSASTKWVGSGGGIDIMRPSYWRPVLIDGQIVGVMWIESGPRSRFSPNPPQYPGMQMSSQFSSSGDLMIVRSDIGRPTRIVSVSEGTAVHSSDIAGQDPGQASLDQVTLGEPSLGRLEAAFQNSLLWTGLIAGLAGCVAVALFTRQALRPVRTLTAAARQVGHGDLGRRVPAGDGNGEIEELSRTFNLMAEGLQLAEERRKKMTADIAHELRTPLTNIQGYLEAMRDGVISPDTDALRTLHLQATHLARLVDDLRLLSVAEAGALKLELAEQDVATLAHESARAFKPRADAADVVLEVDVDDDLPPVTIDEGRVRQVIGNLVENALSHSPKGGRIRIAARRGSLGGVALEIRDSGPGIPSAEIERIFEQFYRIDGSRSRSTGGVGLGLTIVKRLVEAHGGTVSVSSDYGDGARFIVELPLSPSPS